MDQITSAPAALCAAQLFAGTAAFSESCETAVGASRAGIVICNLGVLEGGRSSFANAVSEDGQIVVGVSGTSMGERAFRWTKAEGMTNLGTLPGGTKSQARDVSADGTVIIGSSNSTQGHRAFLWTQDTGMVSLGNMDTDLPSSAYAVSADGRVVVGSLGEGQNRSAFRWSAKTGMTKIDTLGFDGDSAALGVSGDGTVVVGRIGFAAFRWTEQTGTVLLAPQTSSVAYDASQDGGVIVGSVGPVYSKRKAVEWHHDHGVQAVNPAMNEARSTPLDISRDGLFIVGAINRHIAFLRKRGADPILLGGRRRAETDFASDKANGSGANGSIVVGSSTGPEGHRAVRWQLSD